MRSTHISIVAAALVSAPLFASEEVKLPTIELFGSQESAMHYVAGSTTLITQEVLEKSVPLSLQDALRKTAGIHAIETDGYGFYPRITVRGIGSDMSKKVLLLEDGAPIALGPYTDPAAYYHPPVERMERVEILKGSGTLAHGPSTIGGAINYITKQPREGFSGLVGLGNLGYRVVGAEYGTKVGDTTLGISLLKKEGDGWRNMPFDVTDLVVKAATPLDEHNSLGVKYTQYAQESMHTYLGLTQNEYSSDHTQNKATTDKMFLERSSLDVTHEFFGLGGVTLKTLAYYNQARRDWWRDGVDFNATTGLNTMKGDAEQGRLRTFDIKGIDSRATLDIAWGALENSTEIGAKYHNEVMHNRRTNSAIAGSYSITSALREDDVRKAEAYTLFGENRMVIAELFSLTAGLRVERYYQTREIRRYNNVDVGTTTSVVNTEIIPGVGATFMPTKEITIFAGAHRGFAPPRVQDAVTNDGTAVALEAERSINYELGLRATMQDSSFEVTAFSLDFENQIVQATESGGSGTIGTNAGKTLNQGIELAFASNLPMDISVGANYTYLPVAKLTSTRIIGGIDRNGNRLTYAPEHLANLFVGYQHAASWGTQLGYSYVSEQFSDLANSVDGSANGKTGLLSAYGVWDASGWIQFNKNTKIHLAAKNLTNEKYIASRAPDGIMSGMGLNLQASIRVLY
ncbi:MAG: hypothetical protein KU37_05455 [Sulfuricurvum sp. PC08-66]|nr:MAG: hypothetical protein KU37_05455 [Sulfuricurvum sp. PC08-66]